MDYNVALMIDAENVGSKYIDQIMKEISKYGRIVIARFYGDIFKLSKEWKDKVMDHAIKPMHQFNVAYGKNAADMEMALDAMEIRYQNRANLFFIVSSDSDFTPLAIRLKESGAIVIGIGDEKKVTNAFKSACSEFKYFDYFDIDEDLEVSTNDDIRTAISTIIIQNGENNQLLLSRLGDILKNQSSDFDPRKYGVSNLSALVNKYGFQTVTEGTVTNVIYESNVGVEDIKKLIDKTLGNNDNENIGKLKNIIDKKYPDFNIKQFGYNKFSLFIKSLGYNIDKNTYAKKR